MINYDFPYAYENKLYHTLAFENQARGYKLYKASVDAGFTCPNLDGSRGTGGCIFCSGGSGYFTAASEVPLEDQLAAEVKSSVAPYLNGRFVDMDQVIEDKIGMSITDFFAKEGEASFRQIESETLEELLQEGDDVIISTGGGVVVTECNRKLLKKNRKHNVWLHSSFDVVYNRIKKDIKNQRPLFLNHSKEEFKAIYDGRMALYKGLADLVVTVDNRTPEEVARFIKCM